MPTAITGRTRPTKPKKQARSQKRKRDDVDVEKLEEAVRALDPSTPVTKFSDLPISESTKAGLKACHFQKLTDIQARAIAHALKGADILGAAKTGSGKTLAFIVPVLENLYRQQVVGLDAGLGAVIISPTRELAIQIFEVLYKIGKHGHLFAAGLVIGGKSLQDERQALARMNIVVCTPGRMLQHLSQTAGLNVDNLKMLVLDEADRILDMGFQRDVDAIVEYLPATRQTLLFSATQTRKISDLARLSLRDPEYISVHEAASAATPQNLQQNYVLTPLPTKLDTLWSFIQSAKKSKLLVFLSSGKQVRYVYESFRRMQPGISLLQLHGRQRQSARLDITTKFAAARQACLFATDVAARGLDFPAVDWVVQVDCPEDADTYIHRVGRTARYEQSGRAILFLDPSEELGMLENLASKNVPIERINVRQKKQTSIKNQIQGMCFQDPELKYLGQKAFASYIRSLHVQPDKEVFNINAYDLPGFADSLGLPGAPKIRYLKGDAEAAKKAKNAPRMPAGYNSDSGSGGESKHRVRAEPAVRTKYDRMFERRNQDIFADHYARMIDENGVDGHAEAEADDALFTVKRRLPADEEADSTSGAESDGSLELADTPFTRSTAEPLLVDSKRRVKALKSKKKVAKLLGTSAQKMVFDDDGTARPARLFKDESALLDKEAEKRAFVDAERVRLGLVDQEDRDVAKARRKEKKIKRKDREVAEGEADSGDVGLPVMNKPFEDLQDLYESDGSGRLAGQHKPARAKKWFERDEDARPNGKVEDAQPETLEDLEALAAGLLS